MPAAEAKHRALARDLARVFTPSGMAEKRCPKCQNVQDLETAFGMRKDHLGRPIPHSWCRACRISGKEKYQRDKEIERLRAAGLYVRGGGPPPELKVCPKCNVSKNVEKDFGTRTNQYGRVKAQSWCRACRNATGAHRDPRMDARRHAGATNS